MERQKSPSRESIDLLSYLHRHPDGWRVVGEANAALSSAGTEAQKAEAEMRSFGEVGELLGDDNLYNQKTYIVGLARTELNSELNLVALEGRYDTITSWVDSDGREEICVCIKAGRGSDIDRYYFPLDDGMLARFEVEVEVIEGVPEHVAALRGACRRAKNYLQSREFNAQSPEDAEDQSRGVIEDINNLLQEYIDRGVVYVEGVEYSEHIVAPGQYFVGPGSSVLRTLEGSWAQFILPEGSSEPILELVDSKSQHKRWVHPESITDIFSPNSDTEDESVDILEGYFSDDYYEVASNIAVDLGYARQMAADDSEWWEVYQDAVEELEEELPFSSIPARIKLTGFVFTEDDSGFNLEFYDCDDVSISGLDFIEIDKEMRAVITASTYDTSTHEEQVIYIVPSSSYLTRLELVMSEDERAASAIDFMHEQAQIARQIAHSVDFYKLTLEEQHSMLSAPADMVNEQIEVLVGCFGDSRMDFRVRRFYQVPTDVLPVTGWHSELIGKYRSEDEALLSVVADTIDVYNPDIDSIEGDRPLESLSDLPLSGGEPMVVMEDQERGMLYLVRISDIIHCAPVFEVE